MSWNNEVYKQNDKKVKSVYFIQFLLLQNTLYIAWLRHSEIITDHTTATYVCLMLSERKKQTFYIQVHNLSAVQVF